jgi:integration host factor subunit beta
MIKSELIECVMNSHPGFNHRDSEIAVNAVFDAIAEAIGRGDRVEIRGFGTFSAKERGSRIGRNPRTGQSVPVSAKTALRFKASREILQALNHRSDAHHAVSGHVTMAAED